jgi:hypothetical protein
MEKKQCLKPPTRMEYSKYIQVYPSNDILFGWIEGIFGYNCSHGHRPQGSAFGDAKIVSSFGVRNGLAIPGNPLSKPVLCPK